MVSKAAILLAERDHFSAEHIDYFLRSEGYDVETVFDSQAALGTVRERKLDLAIVDLLISGARGRRLCSQLREGTDTPVVAISSLASADSAFSAGASAFLQKPVEPLELIGTVEKLLNSNPARHEEKTND
jgi:DNA-binding response OmpR family regulator